MRSAVSPMCPAELRHSSADGASGLVRTTLRTMRAGRRRLQDRRPSRRIPGLTKALGLSASGSAALFFAEPRLPTGRRWHG